MTGYFKAAFLILFMALIVFHGQSVHAAETVPDDACAVEGAFKWSGGPEMYNKAYLMVCESSVWVRYLEFNDDGISPIIATDSTSCTSSIQGRVRYETSNSRIEFCNGTAWTALSGPAQTKPSCSDDAVEECLVDASRNLSDQNFIAADIAFGVNILGVTGTLNTVLPDCSDDTAAACQLQVTRVDNDPELIPSNIVEGVNVLNVVGTYDRHSLRWPEGTSIAASDASSSDEFASDMALDNKVLVVGAPLDDGAGTDRGAVYTYFLTSGGAWSEMQILTAGTPEDNARFGESVDVEGYTALIGASLEDGAGTDRGAAYIWRRATNGTWTQTNALTASDAADGDLFGASVSVKGGLSLVGAPSADGAGTDRGAAYLFFRDNTDGSWSEQTIFTASDAADGDSFGHDVSVYGGRLAISANLDNSSEGAVYMFERDINNSWSQLTKLTASDGAAGDQFGFSISLHGDTLAVGAPLEDGSGTDRGAVYVFQNDNGTWSQVTKLTAEDTSDGDQFGYDVTLYGDSIIVGAPYHDNGGTDRGVAYIYDRLSNGSWAYVHQTAPAASADNDRIGSSTAMRDQFALIGAPAANGSTSDEGLVFEFVDDTH